MLEIKNNVLTKIKKRDGREVEFDESKITDAIFTAAQAVGGEDYQLAEKLKDQVVEELVMRSNGHTFEVEEIQDVVEKILIENGHAKTAKAYILYRNERNKIRESKDELMDSVKEILKETSRENANVGNTPSAKMLQIASAASKKYYLSRVIPREISEAHRGGDIHIHDLEFYSKTLTCIYIPLQEKLKKGFDTGHGFIRPPKRAMSASALAAIMLQSSQNDMHGGQSFAFFDRDMAEFVKSASEDETYQAMEALVYNLNSMHSRAGSQVPFSNLNLGGETSEAARKVTRNFLLAFEAGLGRGENPIFPNVIFRLKEGVNMNPGDPNYDLFQLAIRVACRRLNPTFSFMNSSFNKAYGDQVSYMGCRTRVMANNRGPEVTDGRGNLSFTTVNLPRIGIKSGGSMDKFYKLLDEKMELAIRQLYERFKIQANLKVADMPFLMGQGLYLNSENLDENDTIYDAIVNGTLSVGFIGLAETLITLIGEHHGQSEKAQELGLEIVAYMRKWIDKACRDYNLNYTLLATPAEGLSGRFIGIDREKYGVIPGVTDKDYYTNSYHIPVDHPVSAFEKIKLEGPYHKYCNAGHISYVEMDSAPVHNPQAVEAIIKHMADCDMGYGGINYPVDFCKMCGHSGLIDDDGCPKCGSFDVKRIRRITGYLSTEDRFNHAKIKELHDRKSHIYTSK